MITTTKVSDVQLDVWFGTARLGVFEKSDDGYYYFYTNPYRQGSWTSYMLMEIAQCLDKENAEWDKIVGEGLSKG